ncbi:uncharacterized protein [Mytilus edulis]|uniref:uncharacterized protein n=1 Tax=Mytilus edulis TaxID=6550 RepID=UPI0039F11AA5
MVQIIYLVIVLVSMSKPVLAIIGLNQNMCPHTSQWSLRSTSLCNKSEPEYLCLFDDNENVYKEICQKNSDTQRPGYEFVIRGELDDKECDKDRYQPIKLTTAGHSRCMFDKSKCSEEGQLVYDNGTIISDRLCRCDYTHSYSFVNASKNNCFCDPSTEDCSCYKMNCPDKLVLSPDYMCIELKKFPGNNNCQEIKRPQINIDVSNQEKGHFTIIIPKVLARNRKDLLILFSIFFGAVSVIGLVYRYQYYLKGKRTGKYDKATKSRTNNHTYISL